MYQIVMIGGVPRSGTTILASRLSKVTGQRVSPETHFFTKANCHGLISSKNLNPEVIGIPIVRQAYMSMEGKTHNFTNFLNLLKLILGENDILIEKTPGHLVYFDDLLSKNSNLKVIIVTRKIFDNIKSLRRVTWGGKNILRQIKMCVNYRVKAFYAKKKYQERVLVIPYEHFCQDEQVYIADLKNFIGSCSPTKDLLAENSTLFDVSLEPWKHGADGAVQRMPPKPSTFIEKCFFPFIILIECILNKVFPLNEIQ